jgi:hypothetical protein
MFLDGLESGGRVIGDKKNRLFSEEDESLPDILNNR